MPKLATQLITDLDPLADPARDLAFVADLVTDLVPPHTDIGLPANRAKIAAATGVLLAANRLDEHLDPADLVALAGLTHEPGDIVEIFPDLPLEFNPGNPPPVPIRERFLLHNRGVFAWILVYDPVHDEAAGRFALAQSRS